MRRRQHGMFGRYSLAQLIAAGVLGGGGYVQSILAYNPVAFYDATASNIYEDSARTVLAQDEGDVVGAWDDLSGNEHHITQATTANKPTLRLNVLNGRRIVRFDTTDFIENTAFVDIDDNFTIFAVVAFSALGGAGQGLFDIASATNFTGIWHYTQTGVVRFAARDSAASRIIVASDLRDDVARLHTMHNTGSELQYWINQTSIGTTAYGAPNPNVLTQLELGRAFLSDTGKNDIASFILFDRTLDNSERETIENLINTRWSLY